MDENYKLLNEHYLKALTEICSIEEELLKRLQTNSDREERGKIISTLRIANRRISGLIEKIG